jgi:hypothetical protein
LFWISWELLCEDVWKEELMAISIELRENECKTRRMAMKLMVTENCKMWHYVLEYDCFDFTFYSRGFVILFYFVILELVKCKLEVKLLSFRLLNF